MITKQYIGTGADFAAVHAWLAVRLVPTYADAVNLADDGQSFEVVTGGEVLSVFTLSNTGGSAKIQAAHTANEKTSPATITTYLSQDIYGYTTDNAVVLQCVHVTYSGTYPQGVLLYAKDNTGRTVVVTPPGELGANFTTTTTATLCKRLETIRRDETVGTPVSIQITCNAGRNCTTLLPLTIHTGEDRVAYTPDVFICPTYQYAEIGKLTMGGAEYLSFGPLVVKDKAISSGGSGGADSDEIASIRESLADFGAEQVLLRREIATMDESLRASIADFGAELVTLRAEFDNLKENGGAGTPGQDGKDGYTPQKGVDYWTEEDKGEINAESKEFIADQLADLTQIEPLFADSVEWLEENGDTTKVYVLPDGFLYAHTTKEVLIKAENKLDLSTVALNARLSGSSGSVTANGSPGSFVTDFIAVSDLANSESYNIRLNWELTRHDDNKVVFYDSNKNRIGSALICGSHIPTTISNGETIFDLRLAPTEPAWTDVAYVRFHLFLNDTGTNLTSDDIANFEITFDAEIKTGVSWCSTGHAFIPADYEDRIIDLENDVLRLKNGITKDEITVPDFWKNSVEECVAKIKALQVGRNCVTFPFFSDNHQRNGYSGLLIAKVMKECHIPYAFFGGDSIDSGYIASEAVMIEQDKKFDTAMSYIPNGRFCRAVGNHDGYWAVDANTKNYYTDAQNYELFLREESIAQNKHFGGDGTYYYVDDSASMVRWIVLDTNDGTVEETQIEWIRDVAMSFNTPGWAIVFISHQPISNHYHAGISNAAEVRAVVKNYINDGGANKADVVGWFSGHIHRDRIYTGIAANETDDTQGEAMGFTQVTITSDHTSIAYDDATKHTVANDTLSHAIDFVTINKTARTVNITRLGIGSDRSYTY